MEGKRNQNLDENIHNDHDKSFLLLISNWDKEIKESQKIISKLKELKLLKVILYSLITSNSVSIVVLVSNGIHHLIILMNIGLEVLFLIYLKYLSNKLNKL